MKGTPEIRKYLFYILIGVVFISLFVLYAHLGGFRKIEVQKIESQSPYTLILGGKPYKGRIQDNAWKDLFILIRKEISKKNLTEPLTIIYYSKPEENKGKTDAFIGAGIGELSELPQGFSEKIISVKGVLRVHLAMHPVIFPSPVKIKKLIRKFADENKLSLDSILIEKYHIDNSLTVEVPVL